jgi:hypothetical protein
MELPQGKDWRVIVHTHENLLAAREQMEKKVKKAQQYWEKRLWHLSNQTFACESDAQDDGAQTRDFTYVGS